MGHAPLIGHNFRELPIGIPLSGFSMQQTIDDRFLRSQCILGMITLAQSVRDTPHKSLLNLHPSFHGKTKR
jgi:hypothetical protein